MGVAFVIASRSGWNASRVLRVVVMCWESLVLLIRGKGEGDPREANHGNGTTKRSGRGRREIILGLLRLRSYSSLIPKSSTYSSILSLSDGYSSIAFHNCNYST